MMVEVTQADRLAAILELAKLCHEGGITEERRQMRDEAAAATRSRGLTNMAYVIRAIPIGDE